jgi:hypothetical protein
MDASDLEPRQRIGLIDRLEPLETLKIQLHEFSILCKDADLLSGEQRSASDTGGEDHGCGVIGR